MHGFRNDPKPPGPKAGWLSQARRDAYMFLHPRPLEPPKGYALPPKSQKWHQQQQKDLQTYYNAKDHSAPTHPTNPPAATNP